MSWIDITSKQEKPSNQTIEVSWGAVKLTASPETWPVVDQYLTELRRINVNGSAFIARFHVNSNTDFDWFASRNQGIEFFSWLFSHPAFASALPGVATNVNTAELAYFEWCSPLTLDGELARTLVRGGAYVDFQGTHREAKSLGERVAESLFGDRFEDVLVYRCSKPWSAWFFDVAWDSTTVLIDKRLQTITVLVSTDTD